MFLYYKLISFFLSFTSFYLYVAIFCISLFWSYEFNNRIFEYNFGILLLLLIYKFKKNSTVVHGPVIFFVVQYFILLVWIFFYNISYSVLYWWLYNTESFWCASRWQMCHLLYNNSRNCKTSYEFMISLNNFWNDIIYWRRFWYFWKLKLISFTTAKRIK